MEEMFFYPIFWLLIILQLICNWNPLARENFSFAISSISSISVPTWDVCPQVIYIWHFMPLLVFLLIFLWICFIKSGAAWPCVPHLWEASLLFREVYQISQLLKPLVTCVEKNDRNEIRIERGNIVTLFYRVDSK